MKRRPVAGSAFRWWATLLFYLTLANMFAATKQWDGGGGSPFWNVAGNWTDNVAPVAGDDLFFPSGVGVFITTNNYGAGTAFGKISVTTSDTQRYILGGARVTLNGGFAYSGTVLSADSLITCDFTLGADQLFTGTRHVVTLAGRVDLNNHFLYIGPPGSGTLRFDGTITNSASPNAYVIKTNLGTLIIGSGARFQVAHYWNTDPPRDWPSLDVQLGTLRLDGIATNGNLANPVVIRISGTLIGNGFADRVVVWSGGVVSPGVGGPGVLRCNNIYVENPSARLQLDINGTTPGTQYDQVITDGYPGWNGVLDLRFGYLPKLGDTFFLMVPMHPIGNPFTPGTILDHTNGCSFGTAVSSNGYSLTTLRRPDSPFTVWRGAFYGSFPFFTLSTTWSPTNNWSGGIGPASGARLVFTEYGLGQLHPIMTNDLAPGFSLASLTFRGTNSPSEAYALYGNPLTILEGITNRTGQGTNTLMVDLVAAGAMVFDVDAGSVLRFGRSFSGGGTMRKTGGGQLHYTGTTVNSFVGDFILDNGNLRVDGTLTDGSITVTGGMLSGTGTVASVTMTGGMLNPGGSPGILRVQGNLDATPGATCRFEVNSPIAGTGYDQLQVNGAVALNGATLDIQPGYTVPVGSVFLLLVNDAADPIVGTFAGLPQGAVFPAGGQYFSISYQSGGGNNDVVLTRVNPPPVPGQFANISLVSPGTVQFQGHGGSNITYTIQVNTNLATTNWQTVGTTPADALGQFTFTDTNILTFPQRFYRLRWP